jgi:hypothetical protein
VAAVAVAIGILGCAAHDPGVAEAAPPPLDGTPSGGPPPPRPRAPATCELAPVAAPEPPPVHVEEPPFRHDQGVAEAAPPPYRHDHGVAEAAPPPYLRPIAPPAQRSFEIRTVPVVPLEFGAVRVAQPFAYPEDGQPLVVGDGKGAVPIRARIALSAAPDGATAVDIASDDPLTVRCGEASSAVPAHVVLRGAAHARAFTLEDPRSGKQVTVHVSPSR